MILSGPLLLFAKDDEAPVSTLSPPRFALAYGEAAIGEVAMEAAPPPPLATPPLFPSAVVAVPNLFK